MKNNQIKINYGIKINSCVFSCSLQQLLLFSFSEEKMSIKKKLSFLLANWPGISEPLCNIRSFPL